MTLQAAIRKRVEDLCEEHNLSVCTLYARCGISNSTVLGIPRRQSTRLDTIEKICDGIGISLADFFCCDTFRNLDPQ